MPCPSTTLYVCVEIEKGASASSSGIAVRGILLESVVMLVVVVKIQATSISRTVKRSNFVLAAFSDVKFELPYGLSEAHAGDERRRALGIFRLKIHHPCGRSLCRLIPK